MKASLMSTAASHGVLPDLYTRMACWATSSSRGRRIRSPWLHSWLARDSRRSHMILLFFVP